jgi:DNA recombination protein RmuC
VGTGLKRAVDSYNRATASLDTRVLVTARRFRELNIGVEKEEITSPPPVELLPRSVQSAEFQKQLPGPGEAGGQEDEP